MFILFTAAYSSIPSLFANDESGENLTINSVTSEYVQQGNFIHFSVEVMNTMERPWEGTVAFQHYYPTMETGDFPARNEEMFLVNESERRIKGFNFFVKKDPLLEQSLGLACNVGLITGSAVVEGTELQSGSDDQDSTSLITILSNGSLDILQTATVHANVKGRPCTIADTSTVEGSIDSNVPDPVDLPFTGPTFPSSLQNECDNGRLSSPYNSTSASIILQSNETVELPGGVYMFQSLAIRDTSEIKFLGQTLLFISGDVACSGNSRFNVSSPKDVAIFTLGSVHIHDDCLVKARIFAMNGIMEAYDNAEFMGTIMADQVVIQDEARIRLDRSATQTWPVFSHLKLVSSQGTILDEGNLVYGLAGERLSTPWLFVADGKFRWNDPNGPPAIFGGYGDYSTVADADILKRVIWSWGYTNFMEYYLKWNWQSQTDYLNFHRIWATNWSVSTCAQDEHGEQHYTRQNDSPYPYDMEYDYGSWHQKEWLDDRYRTRLIANMDKEYGSLVSPTQLNKYFGRLRRLCQDALNHPAGPMAVQVDFFEYFAYGDPYFWICPWNAKESPTGDERFRRNQDNTTNNNTTEYLNDVFLIQPDGSDPQKIRRYNIQKRYVEQVVAATSLYGNVIYVPVNELPDLKINPLAPGGLEWEIYWTRTVLSWILYALSNMQIGGTQNHMDEGEDRAVGIIFQELYDLYGLNRRQSLQKFINDMGAYAGPSGRHQAQWLDFVSYHGPWWGPVVDADCSVNYLANHITWHQNTFQGLTSPKLDLIIDDDGVKESCRSDTSYLSAWARTCLETREVSFNHKDLDWWVWGQGVQGDTTLCQYNTPDSCCWEFPEQGPDKNEAQMFAIGQWLP